MSFIASTEIITPKSLSSEAQSQLINALCAVHNPIFDGVERESFAKYVVLSKAEHTWIQVQKLVLSGTVEFAHPAPQVAAQGSLLLEVKQALRVVAQESARIVLLPREALPC
jgi:hypothetical protein